MTRLILYRLGEALVSLLLMSLVVFMLARLTGDPVAVLLGEGATAADKTALIAELGLDRSLPEQYLIFLGNVLQGDFGRSLMGDQSPAFGLVLERLPYSLLLASVSLVIALGIGVPLGVAAAVHRGKPLDVAARAAALLGQSIPPFWLGLVLIYVFAVQLGWARTSGFGGIANIALPAFTMALFSLAAIVRLVRGAMIEGLTSEYVKLARAKGLSERNVTWGHAFRNSVFPVVTFMGSFFATMITGAVVIETVFSWPGIGRLALESILRRDFAVIQAVVLTITTLYIAMNLIVDLVYAWIDPRVREAAR
jgi:peptide/nickel transport system permease protein